MIWVSSSRVDWGENRDFVKCDQIICHRHKEGENAFIVKGIGVKKWSERLLHCACHSEVNLASACAYSNLLEVIASPREILCNNI